MAPAMTTVGEHVGIAPLPYELRVGVTGHRQLSESPAAAAVCRVLESIQAVLAPSPDVPLRWTIVSPLAAGADQIVAREVLRLPDARLEVVTPFRLDRYRADFPSPDASAAFHSLLARADTVHEIDDPLAERDAAYLAVGRWVVDTCELVIALWNGRPAKGTGGTGDVVDYAVRRGRTVIWINTTDLERAATVLKVKPDDGVKTAPFPTTAGRLSPGYEQQRSFVTAHIPALRLRRDVADAERQFGQRDGLDGLLGWFARADLLARTCQDRHVASVRAVLYFAGAAITAAAVQSAFLPHAHWLSWIEAGAMLGALTAWGISRTQGWHRRWLQNRYLAERLRATTFLALLGRRNARVDDDPLPYYPGPSQWIERVCARVEAVLPATANPVDKATVLGRWLTDQRRFHSNSANATRRRVRRRHGLEMLMFVATLVMALVHAMTGNAVVAFVAVVLPVWAGVVHGVTVQLELERITARSGGMTKALDELIARTGRLPPGAELERIIDDAAALMATEAREWWTLLSFQEVHLHV